MMLLDRLKRRFADALAVLVDPQAENPWLVKGDAAGADGKALSAADLDAFAGMVRPTADPKFGDYQSNCAMPIAKLYGKPPREVAGAILEVLDWEGLCHPPEIAGPGFINLRLRDDFLASVVAEMLRDDHLAVEPAAEPRTILIDYSSPNVAKPMHVGHIRSTVIGDALARTFRFLGHRVITDNHLGDWGTQFGMVIYGFKHFGDEAALAAGPVDELSRLYRLVNRLIAYHAAVADHPGALAAATAATELVARAEAAVAGASDAKAKRTADKELAAAVRKQAAARQRAEDLQATLAAAQADPDFLRQAVAHAGIADKVLQETAKLHSHDPENRALWERFLPHCRDEIDRVYRRLDVRFDHTLGESFYHDSLGDVVQRLRDAGLATDSEGAVCVFLPEFDSPMVVQKKDGAYLYATTDLATLFYRRETFRPDEILYVVDSRQGEHFQKLFAAAARLGFQGLRLEHVQFGTVLGEDGRPFKTRSGTSVGLESLLDEAVAKALEIVCDPQRVARSDGGMDAAEQQQVANAVGHGAIKYADLAHHRTSDYRFDLDKMVALEGNTSAYVQYAYARARGIMLKGGMAPEAIAASAQPPLLGVPAERALALTLSRFGESLQQVRADDAPNFLVDYLYDAAKAYAVFNDQCPVLKADSPEILESRMVLVALTARVLETGLGLLGIRVVPRM